MATSARLLINGFYSHEDVYFMLGFTLATTWSLSASLSSRKFAECCVCDLGPTLTLTVQFCLIKLSTVTNAHTCIHAYIYTYMHTQSHTFIYSCIHKHTRSLSCTYIHTEVIHTQLHWLLWVLIQQNPKNKQNHKNIIPSVSNPKISPSIHFKWQVLRTVSLQMHISFSHCFPQVLPFQYYIYRFSLCLALQQWQQTQHYIYRFLLVSCSPTMTANTNTTFTAFYLCLALQQWQQTPTLSLLLPCVLLSNNDSRHQRRLFFTLCLTLLQWQQTPTLPLLLPCVLLSNNDSKHKHCITFTLCLALLQWQQRPTLSFLYLVSCSLTMTANTDIVFTFTLCLALLHWQQTNLSLYHLKAFVP